MKNIFPPWQHNQWNYLLQRWQKDNLPHALLFAGNSGLGKKTFAHLFAKTLLCTKSKAQAMPCEQCRSCQLFNAQSHPDFHLIKPEEEGKAIRIDQIRELITQVNQTAHQASYKVIVIQSAELLNVMAANALLKTLEEPTAQTVFLLVSDQASLLPITVRSRCQTLLFHFSSPMAFVDETQKQRQKKLIDTLNDLTDKQTDPIASAAHWQKINLVTIIHDLLSILLDIARLQNQSNFITHKDQQTFLQGLAHRTTSFRLFTFVDFLYNTKHQLNLSHSLNAQLLIEDLFCRWQELFLSC